MMVVETVKAPQSLVRTEKMGDGGGDMPVDDSEWKAWMQS